MKSIISSLVLSLLIGIFVSCNETDISRDYPRVETLPVTNISSAGAALNAEIVSRGGYNIISYGFAWQARGDAPKINSVSNVIRVLGNLQENTFSAEIEEDLTIGTTYYVRAFVETDDYIIYGPSVPFIIN